MINNIQPQSIAIYINRKDILNNSLLNSIGYNNFPKYQILMSEQCQDKFFRFAAFPMLCLARQKKITRMSFFIKIDPLLCHQCVNIP